VRDAIKKSRRRARKTKAEALKQIKKVFDESRSPAFYGRVKRAKHLFVSRGGVNKYQEWVRDD